MRRHPRILGRIFLALAASLAGFPTASAQLVADGATNILSAVTNAVSGELTVGTNGSATSLVLTNAAEVNVSGATLIGQETGSFSNAVNVTGPGARLTTTSNLYVASNGWGNQLTISEGGVVASAQGSVGFDSSASNNSVTLTGPNSVWTNSSTLTVGEAGSFNLLSVSDGSVVYNTSSVIGKQAGANGNSVAISGAGSRWINSGTLSIGSTGSFNQLIISGGGAVSSSDGYLGLNGGSSNSLALVTGAGSLWTNRYSLIVGNSGSGNQLVVSNGGVVANTYGYLGLNGGSSNNLALVTGAGSLWTNSGNLIVGYSGSGNQLVVSNGAMVANGYGHLGFNVGASYNVVVVTGAGSLWTNSGNLIVGYSGSGNQLVVSNGAMVANGYYGYLGFNVGASNNVVVVAGAGSLWTNRYGLEVGISGSGNQLVVSNGGVVQAGSAIIVGSAAGAANNSLVASGGTLASMGLTLGGSRSNSVTLQSGSTWDLRGGTFTWGNASIGDTLSIDGSSALTNIGALTLDESSTAFFLTNALGGYSLNGFTTNQLQFNSSGLGALVVGNSGTNVQLTISDYVWAGTTGTLGNNVSARSNSVLVTGAGSLWTNSSELYVGLTGSGNQLVVSNGGVVANVNGFIGNQPGANNNVAVVTGAGTLWANSSNLYVGYYGNGHQLVASNGGVVVSANGYVGNNFNANNNVAVVTGAGSLWANSSNLYVGNYGNGNQLVASNGGVVASVNGVIGNQSGANNNVAVVTGAGTLWTNSSTLYVGYFGSGNRLVVSNGGVVATTFGSVGRLLGAENNVAVVTGAGSLWTNSGYLIVGESGWLNQLVVNSGGVMASGSGYIGRGNNNQVTVTGTNSQWLINSFLHVGYGGSGNQLMVSNGGVVANVNGYIGNQPGASNNVAVVTGAGSLWTNTGNLYVGIDGSGNRLVVSNGGTVANASVFLGGYYGANNNQVTVTGTNSQWRNSGTLSVGDGNTTNNQVTIRAGGLVVSSGGRIGTSSANANFNRVLVADPGSTWTNSSFLYVGDSGYRNELVVSNGGTVIATSVTVGHPAPSLFTYVSVYGGNLIATNVSGTGTLDIRGGSGVLTAGLIVTDNLLLTNSAGSFGFSGGTLITRGGKVSNDRAFVVGASGTTAAILNVQSNAPLVLSNGFTLGANTAAAGNQLLITNGGMLRVTGFSFVGTNVTSSNNLAVVSGAGSLWTNSGGLRVGEFGDGNQLIVSDGGTVANTAGIVGFTNTANSNTALITGTGSRWLNSAELWIGRNGSSNSLLIADGGSVSNGLGIIGSQGGANRNTVTVTGAGSSWLNSGELWIGESGVGNRLLVTNGGTVTAMSNAVVGRNSASLNNRVTVDGGTLSVTNASGNAVLDIRRGTNVLNAGLIVSDRLLLTNVSLSRFEFNGGTLNVRSATVNNSALFTVGNSTTAATYRMSGETSNLHSFANALVIASNATLTGNGTITGSVTNFGTLAPGSSPGALTINGSLSLRDSANLSFELGGLIATNQYDQLTVTNFVEFAGTLSLALLNNFLPDDGDTFTLLRFGSASGSFANVTGGRVSLSNQLASFAVTLSATNLILSGATYVDTDGDGQGDLQEAAAGTDPNSSASYLGITALTQNGSGHNVITFQSIPAKTYRIEYSNDLVTWPIATTNVPSAGTNTVWTDDGTLTGGLPGNQRFYRVGLQ